MQERYGAQAPETGGGVAHAEDVTVGGLGERVPGGADAHPRAANGARIVHEWDVTLPSGMQVLCTLGE